MRTNIQFEVTGSTLPEMYEKVGKTYRQLLGDPEAVLPHTTHVEVEAVTEELNTAGRETVREILGWTGRVTISTRYAQ